MDPETNRDMTASIGIRDGKIAAIEPERLTGQEGIDAAGLVIAPGFIDLHMHGQTIPSMRMNAVRWGFGCTFWQGRAEHPG